MRVRASFMGFSKSRTKSIVSSIEDASNITITAVTGGDAEAAVLPPDAVDTVFINREQNEERLIQSLEIIREASADVPIVLIYGPQPDGKAYLLANRFDCWLFSEKDRLERALTAAEVGSALAKETPDAAFERRLFEVSLSAGPCSTGS